MTCATTTFEQTSSGQTSFEQEKGKTTFESTPGSTTSWGCDFGTVAFAISIIGANVAEIVKGISTFISNPGYSTFTCDPTLRYPEPGFLLKIDDDFFLSIGDHPSFGLLIQDP